MFMPSTVTASDSFFRRLPPQVLQGVIRMNSSYICLEDSENVSR